MTKVKVWNLCSPRSGREVPNQFVISIGNAVYFQSYDTVIAKIENGKVEVDEDWNCSRTTSKYRNEFFDRYAYEYRSLDALRKAIKEGEVKVVNLNG